MKTKEQQFFRVRISRIQTQTQFFTVKANNKADLEKRLQELDDEDGFGDIDERFDEGEVDSIEYSVLDVKICKKESSTFADEDLQDLIDQ
jgi:hypothetical protein